MNQKNKETKIGLSGREKTAKSNLMQKGCFYLQ